MPDEEKKEKKRKESKHKTNKFVAVWQDREIRFDTPTAHLQNRKGEAVIDSINSVEDTKGNNGERGSLVVTNLRIMWISHKNSRTNLSIGFNTVVSINIRKAKSKLRGATQALYIMTKFGGSRFEFIFTSLVQHSPRLFTTVQAVLRRTRPRSSTATSSSGAPSCATATSCSSPRSPSTPSSRASGT